MYFGFQLGNWPPVTAAGGGGHNKKGARRSAGPFAVAARRPDR
jgi:hypothetical protein